LADSSKFDRSAPYRVCDLSDLDGIVTDAPLPAEGEWGALRMNVVAPAADPSR
jgi:DeoR/GlpR family transcriptional regulator of sugar metabolism